MWRYKPSPLIVNENAAPMPRWQLYTMAYFDWLMLRWFGIKRPILNMDGTPYAGQRGDE